MKSILLITLFITSLYALKGDIMLTDSLNPQAQFSWPVDIGKVTDMQLYDMLARYFGAPRNQAINGNQLNLNIDLFNRPTGNLLFSISGLSSSKMPQNGLKVMSSTPLVDLIPSVQSTAGYYGILAGVLTGNENNGVETEKTIPAGKDIYAKTMGNFYDALSKLYPQKQMVSASSALEGAMVLSPHLKNFGSQVKSMYWEKRQKSFVSVSEASSFSISVKDFPALMKTLATVLGKPVKYNEIEQTVSVADVEYDLSCEATEALFAEVLFVANMAQHPVSFFSFHFQALSLISAKFSTQSSEYEMAVRMIDAVIAYIQSTYSQHHTLQMTILYFNDNSHTQEVISAIEPILVNQVDIPFGKSLIGTITHDLPYIFLSPEGKSKIGEICDELTYVVADYDLSVECSTNLKRSILQTPEPQPNPSPSPAPTPSPGVASADDVALVHIVLWLVIALVAALLQSCYHLAVLDGSNEPEFKPKTYEGAGVRSKTTKIQ